MQMLSHLLKAFADSQKKVAVKQEATPKIEQKGTINSEYVTLMRNTSFLTKKQSINFSSS